MMSKHKFCTFFLSALSSSLFAQDIFKGNTDYTPLFVLLGVVGVVIIAFTGMVLIYLYKSVIKKENTDTLQTMIITTLAVSIIAYIIFYLLFIL